MDRKKYDVFISYSRKDYVDSSLQVIPNNPISKVKDALTAAGITYWFDEEGIYSGQNFVDKIVTNIDASQIFVFLSTANANNSKFTCKEIASADEFGKCIIPVRIDDSPYNKKVIFRIADLDFIPYYVNPEKGMQDLIAAIKAHLASLQEEEKRKQQEEERRREAEKKKAEEERQKREREERRRREEQQRIIEDIKLACTTLNNEETKHELDRSNLLLSTKKVADPAQRKALQTFVSTSSPIRQRYEKELEDQRAQIATLESELVAQKVKYAHKEHEQPSSEQDDERVAQLQQKLKAAETELEQQKALLRDAEAGRRGDKLWYEGLLESAKKEQDHLQEELSDMENKPWKDPTLTKMIAIIALVSIAFLLFFYVALVFVDMS